jgi:hypothetical protein
MLYCSGLILMAHILVPHHHESSQEKQHHASSHHGDHHEHHHHKSTSEEKAPADNPLSHPLHQESIAKYVTKQTNVSVDFAKIICLIPEYINVCHTILEEINKVHYKPDKDKQKLGCPSSFSLRGPPSPLFS